MSCHRDCNVYLNQDLEQFALAQVLSRDMRINITPPKIDPWDNYKKCIEQCNNSISANQKRIEKN